MKKELIIIIGIILLVIIGNIITQNYTKQCIARVNENLEDLKENVQSTQRDNTKLKEKMTNLEKDWDEMQEKLAFYIEHDELEKVETQIFLLKGHIEGELYKETLSEIEKCSFILEHIADKTALDIKNIF